MFIIFLEVINDDTHTHTLTVQTHTHSTNTHTHTHTHSSLINFLSFKLNPPRPLSLSSLIAPLLFSSSVVLGGFLCSFGCSSTIMLLEIINSIPIKGLSGPGAPRLTERPEEERGRAHCFVGRVFLHTARVERKEAKGFTQMMLGAPGPPPPPEGPGGPAPPAGTIWLVLQQTGWHWDRSEPSDLRFFSLTGRRHFFK